MLVAGTRRFVQVIGGTTGGQPVLCVSEFLADGVSIRAGSKKCQILSMLTLTCPVNLDLIQRNFCGSTRGELSNTERKKDRQEREQRMFFSDKGTTGCTKQPPAPSVQVPRIISRSSNSGTQEGIVVALEYN